MNDCNGSISRLGLLRKAAFNWANLGKCAAALLVAAALIEMLPGSFAAAAPFAVVEIPDPTLQAAIRATLSKPSGDITAADMESLTALDASRATRGCLPPIQSLDGLRAAVNLTSLNLDGAWSDEPIFFPAEDHCAISSALNTGDLSPLSSLGKLQSLYLSGNGLTNLSLPAGLTNLQTLDLTVNSLDHLALPADMTRLQSLRVDGVTNASFLERLIDLRQLSWGVGRWWFDVNPPGEIVFPPALRSLEDLTLSGPNLTNLVFPPDMTNLHRLRLYGNITEAPFLEAMRNLQSLHLEYNRLQSLPHGLTNLVELRLSGNPLTNVSFLNGLKNLAVLSLDSCMLTNELDPQIFDGFSRLRHLDLSYNGFTSFRIPPGSGLTTLADLNLSGNPLTSLDSLRNLKSLTALNLASCSLTNEAGLQFLSALANLRSLSLGLNGLTQFQMPAELASIESFSIENNMLTRFVLTNPHPRLADINLRENSLAQVDLSGARPSLKRVNLSYNPLSGVPFLENFRQLETLEFYTQNLTTFTLPWGLTSLKTLGLRVGALTLGEIPLSAASIGPRLKIIVVSPNFTYVGIPASTDLSQLTLHGHWKDRVTVLGLWMRPPVLRPDGSLSVGINGAEGRTVHIQTSADLQAWHPWQTVVLGPNGAELMDAASSATPRFFRITSANGNP